MQSSYSILNITYIDSTEHVLTPVVGGISFLYFSPHRPTSRFCYTGEGCTWVSDSAASAASAPAIDIVGASSWRWAEPPAVILSPSIRPAPPMTVTAYVEQSVVQIEDSNMMVRVAVPISNKDKED